MRTNNLKSPFPEEFNRQVTARATSFHFAPTKIAKKNLMKENIDEKKIFITGNTVIDAFQMLQKKINSINFPKSLQKKIPFLKSPNGKIILVTGHRRENFGQGFKNICHSLKKIAKDFPEVKIIYPVHLNPNVRQPVNKIIRNIKNIFLIEPLDYSFFIKLMSLSYLILTDSGGIQEEAPSLGKPVLVMRSTTERPEAIKAGVAILVGTNKEKIYKTTSRLLTDSSYYQKISKIKNPYGDGDSSIKIRKVIREIL